MMEVLFCFLYFLPCIIGVTMSSNIRQTEILREDFQQEIYNLNGKISSLEGKDNALMREFTDLKSAFTDLKGEINYLKVENKELQNELHVLKADKPTTAEEPTHKYPDLAPGNTPTPKRLLVPKRAANGEIMAFHAKLQSTKCFQPQEIVVFDNVVTNTANAYDGSDGIFTAPVSGTYVFIWNFSSLRSSYNVLELVVHGADTGMAISDSEHNTGDLHPSAGIAVVSVEAGQRVFVRKKKGGGTSCAIVADNTFFISTFSGWLL